MKKIFIFLALAFPVLTIAQVGIGTSSPDASAQLEIQSNSKGFLMSRVALTGKNDAATIATPANGLLVFNTATNGTSPNNVTPGFYYNAGTPQSPNWVRLIVPTDNAANVTGTVAIENGGTGAISAAGAISNLGVIASTEKGANNGVATLGSDGKIPSAQIPAVSFQSANVVASEAAMLALSSAVAGSIAIRTDLSKNFVLRTTPASDINNWIELATPTSVTSVNGNSGPSVTLTPGNLGATTLGNSLFTLTNPGAITFPRFNANNTVTALSADDFRTAIGAGTSSTSGTVSSIAVTTGTSGDDVNVSGSPITSSGTITLNIPNASAIARGLVATGAQTFAGTKTFSAAPILSTTTASQALFTDANKNIVSNATTGTGNVVMSNSPTLVTPNLGVPSVLTLTNATALPISGLTGLGTNVATFLGTPSSANLATAVTGETGTGALVFGTSPVLSLPTISSGDGQYPNSLTISPTTHVSSTRASAWIGDWGLLQSVNANTTRDFSITQNLNSSFPSRFFISTSGNIGIGNTSPIARLDIRTSPTSTTNAGEGYLGIGTTSTAANTAGAGALRYDNTGGELEYSNGTAWKPVAVTDAAQTFTGKQTFSDIQLTTAAASGKILTSDGSGNASWQTGAVVIYTEVHTDAGNSAFYSAGSALNDFNTTTADNVKRLYGNSYGFIQGTGTGTNSDKWVAPYTGKFRITTNAYFNPDANTTNPRLYAYKNDSEVCNITSVIGSSGAGLDIATTTSSIIELNKDDFINWKFQYASRIWRGKYHTFFRIESVE